MGEYRHIDHIGKMRNFICRSNELHAIENVLRKKLNRDFQFEDWRKLFSYAQIEIPVCNICKVAYVPHKLTISVCEGLVTVTNVIILKQYTYCYGKSSQCREMNRGRALNPNSSKFISLVMCISEEEAKVWIRNNNSSPFYRENFSSNADYCASQSRDLEWHKKKYGEDLGNLKFKKLIEKQNYSRSLTGLIDKHGDEGTIIYSERCKKKDSMTLPGFRLRNPTLSEAEILQMHKMRRKDVGLTRDAFIKKHGLHKFLECMKTRVEGRSSVSKWSLGLINSLIENFPRDIQILELRYGSGNEICIHDIENRRSYYYDFYVKLPSKKVIIEFNGHRFHADPRLSHDERSNWHNPFRSNLTWKEVYDRDARKLEVAKASGHEVLVFWDYEDKDQIIKKASELIHGT